MMGIGFQEHEAPIPQLFERGPPKQPPSSWTIFFPFLIDLPHFLLFPQSSSSTLQQTGKASELPDSGG